MNSKIAVLFSGGVDSSLVATMAADTAREVHLVTCLTQCLVAPQSMRQRVDLLRDKYPDTTFVHAMLSAKKVMKKLWNGYILRDLLIAGLYRSYPCATCKLSMHIRGLVYCIENGIESIYCGANVMMSFNPCQNIEGLEILKKYYADYGIRYETPVYWYDNVDIMLLSRFEEFRKDRMNQRNIIRGRSTSDEALEKGVGKGDMKLDSVNQYSSQPLCSQSVYSTYFLQYFYFPMFGFNRLKKIMHRRMKSQLASMKKSIDRQIETGKSRVFSESVLSIDK